MKTVLITGAGSGLGLALTKTFLENDWQVFAVYRQSAKLESIDSKALKLIQADLIRPNAINMIVNKLGNDPLDALINNAGLYDSDGEDRALVTSFDDISEIFQVNSIVPKLLSEAITPALSKGQEKLVITISSGMGTYAKLDKYHAEHWTYSASKTAVNYAMLSYGISHPDIKSVLINPGWMKTKIGGDAPI